MLVTGLDPIVGHDPKVLILGSMPGKISLNRQQYYANPQNSFWLIVGEICGAKPELPYPERTTRLTEVGIALWDVLKHCEREGSLDSHISKDSEVPNDFDGFFKYHSTVLTICFNGQKAANSFEKMVAQGLPKDILNSLTLKGLPSTSPANAGISKTEKVRLWTQAIKPYLTTPV